MAWLAVDSDGSEYVYKTEPIREDWVDDTFWLPFDDETKTCIKLPKGSIKKLIGRDLTWDDEPVELKEN